MTSKKKKKTSEEDALEAQTSETMRPLQGAPVSQRVQSPRRTRATISRVRTHPMISLEDLPPSPPEELTALLGRVFTIEGAVAASVVDWRTNTTLAKRSVRVEFDIEDASRGHAGLLKAATTSLRDQGVEDTVDEMISEFDGHIHLVRPIGGYRNIMIYVVLDRERATVPLARRTLASIGAADVLEAVAGDSGA